MREKDYDDNIIENNIEDNDSVISDDEEFKKPKVKKNKAKRTPVVQELKQLDGIHEGKNLSTEEIDAMILKTFPRYAVTTQKAFDKADKAAKLRMKDTCIKDRTQKCEAYYEYVKPGKKWDNLSTDEKFMFYLDYNEKALFYNNIQELYDTSVKKMGSRKFNELSDAEKDKFIERIAGRVRDAVISLHSEDAWYDLTYAQRAEKLPEDLKSAPKEVDDLVRDYGLDKNNVFKSRKADLEQMGFDYEHMEFGPLEKENCISDEYVREDSRMAAEAVKYGINSIDKYSFKSNVNTIDKLIESLDKVTKKLWGTSDNFTNVQTGLKNLKRSAERLARMGDRVTDNDIQRYMDMVVNVDKLAINYLDHKVISSDSSEYAKKRVRAMRDLRRHLHGNIRSLEDAMEARRESIQNNEAEEYKKQHFDNFEKEYYKDHQNATFNLNGALRDAFQGDVDLGKMNSMKGFGAIDRTSVFNVAVLYLLNRGERIENIYDAEKDVQKKQEAYKAILKLMNEKNTAGKVKNEEEVANDKKELARIMNTGLKNAGSIAENLLKKIDFSKPGEELMHDKRYICLMGIGDLQHDIWQETSGVQDELFEAEREAEPNAVRGLDAEGYRDLVTRRTGILPLINRLIVQSKGEINNIVTNPIQEYAFTKIVVNGLRLAQAKRVIKEFKSQNKLDFAKWSVKNFEKYPIERASYEGDVEFAYMLQENPELGRLLLPRILDGSLFQNVKFNFNAEDFTTTLSGMPSMKTLRAIAEVEKRKIENKHFEEKASEALENLRYNTDIKSIQSAENTRKYMEDVSYVQVVNFMKVYKKAGKSLSKVPSYEELRRDLICSDNFRENLLIKSNPPELCDPRKVLKLLNNEDNYMKTIDKNQVGKNQKKSGKKDIRKDNIIDENEIALRNRQKNNLIQDDNISNNNIINTNRNKNIMTDGF